MNQSLSYHIPVLLKECIEQLAIKPDGTYLDGTLGGGGHFSAIAGRLNEKGTAIGIDRDPASIQWVRETLGMHSTARIIIEQSRFSEAGMVLKKHGIDKVDGILIDLGVSSRQIDSAPRGFSYQADAALDMRMDPSQPLTAAHVLASTGADELECILAEYGEIRNAGRMASVLHQASQKGSLKTTSDLRTCLEKEYGPNLRPKMLSKLYQALRIAVNGELDEIKSFLDKAVFLLCEGGRLAVISYHSLEDRLIKTRFINLERSSDQSIKNGDDFFKFKRINKKVIMPAWDEVKSNRRARSAKMRIIERIASA